MRISMMPYAHIALSIAFLLLCMREECYADWSRIQNSGPRKPLESIHFNGKATYEKLCKHHEFEQWKGTCDNPGMIIRRLDISASSFPALKRHQRLYIENKWEYRPSNYLRVRFEDKKDQCNHAIITICLADSVLHAQEGMIHELSGIMAYSSRSIGGGVRLDMDTAFQYKLKDTSFRHTGRRNRPDPMYSEFMKRNYTINDAYAYMMIDDPFKYMIGDHCLYSLGDYIAFTRNNASVVIMFGSYDEKYFQLAQRLDAMLIHVSAQNTSASLELKDVDIVVDEGGFSPMPRPPRRKISSGISRMSREIKSFFDILHWVLFERHRS
ncbi:MAG: hypothetical protein IKN52_07245 [Victivallales bacterium]|nr:hypothetical protein [Victivallales bacterium]